MTEMRKDRRAPASLKVKYKSATVDDFIENFGTDVSRGGIFIKTKKPLDAGALLKFEFQLSDGSPVLHGVGRVAWRRLEQNARPDLPAGMGIKFFKLSDHSRVVVERIESRNVGHVSRYEQTDSAEFAPPLSGNPPAADSGAKPLPNNGKRAGGSGPLTVPPPPAVSSIPPALADVPRRPLGVSKPASRPASSNSGLPKGTLGSFFPETTPRKSSGSPSQRNRDTSEFLASAFQAGAGPEVRAQARAQAERARRDPESVDLARELFGDLGGAATSAAGPTAPPPPAAAQVAEAYGIKTPVPAVELPRAAQPRSTRPSLGDKIPSLEQLVEEAAKPEPRAPSRRPVDSIKPEEPQPLTLAISVPNEPITDSGAPASSGRSRLLLVAALASTVVLGGLAAYVAMQRGIGIGGSDGTKPAAATQPAEPAAPQQAAEPAPPAQEPPPQPAAEEAKPAAVAEPAPAPVAGPPVPVVVQAKHRGAQVLVAGEPKGPAPQKLSLPSNVPVEITVRSPGFAALTRSVTPIAGMPPEVFELTPLPYEIIVQSDPPGATISGNGKTAVAPEPLALGHIDAALSVAVEKEGFTRSSRAVRLDEFTERDGVMRAEIAFKLNPLPPSRRPRPAPAPAAARPAQPPAGEPPEPTAPDSPAPVMQVRPAEPAPEPPAAAPAPAPEPPPPAESPSTP